MGQTPEEFFFLWSSYRIASISIHWYGQTKSLCFISMSHILTVFTFPRLAIAIWEKDDLISTDLDQTPYPYTDSFHPVAWVTNPDPKPACEVLLPTLWHQLPHRHHINHIATLNEPGPFTATRAGQSFVKGVATPDWTVFTTSFFDLLDPETQETAWLDTGGQHWVNRHGNVISQTIAPPYGISANSCSESDMVMWSRRLATLGCHFLENNRNKSEK